MSQRLDCFECGGNGRKEIDSVGFALEALGFLEPRKRVPCEHCNGDGQCDTDCDSCMEAYRLEMADLSYDITRDRYL